MVGGGYLEEMIGHCGGFGRERGPGSENSLNMLENILATMYSHHKTGVDKSPSFPKTLLVRYTVSDDRGMNTTTKQTCSSAEVVSSLSDSQQVTSPSSRALYPVTECRMGFGGTPIHTIAYCPKHCSTQETSSVGVQPQTCFPSSLLCEWLCCPFPLGHQGRNMEEGSLSSPSL